MYIDYDVSVFIITEYNEYIVPDEYLEESDGNGVFVCLTNERLNSEFGNNNSICIYREWRDEMDKILVQEPVFKDLVKNNIHGINGVCSYWQIEFEEIPNNKGHQYNKMRYKQGDNDRDSDLIGFLDGYLSCQNIMSNITRFLTNEFGNEIYTIYEYIPIFKFAQSIKVDFDHHKYNGYIPSIGQLMFISENIKRINDALEKIHGNKFDMVSYGNRPLNENNIEFSYNWWSSTEYNHDQSWGMFMGMTDEYSKNKDRCILPLFNLI